jgi:hypothetical protein
MLGSAPASSILRKCVFPERRTGVLDLEASWSDISI